MVVIGVLAILIAILLPQFTGYTAQAQAISAASEFKNGLTAGYSYYVSITSRSTDAGAYDNAVAKERMLKAMGYEGDGSDPDITVEASVPEAVDVTIKKGNLQFGAVLDITKGQVATPDQGDLTVAPGEGDMSCANDADVCDDLQAEGALTIQ